MTLRLIDNNKAKYREFAFNIVAGLLAGFAILAFSGIRKNYLNSFIDNPLLFLSLLLLVMLLVTYITYSLGLIVFKKVKLISQTKDEFSYYCCFSGAFIVSAIVDYVNSVNSIFSLIVTVLISLFLILYGFVNALKSEKYRLRK